MREELSEEGMRKAYLALLGGFVMVGCRANQVNQPVEAAVKPPVSTTARMEEKVQYMISPAGQGPVTPSTRSFAAYDMINYGIVPAEVDKIMAAISLESGIMRISDNRYRKYFKIGDNAQFWVEFTDAPQGRVVQKGVLQPKQVWHRYAADRIVIPEAQ